MRTGFESNIQDNKDWNSTRNSRSRNAPASFESNIQDNKDWNPGERHWSDLWSGCLRATSRITRIETGVAVLIAERFHEFESNIQDNKDWNEVSKDAKTTKTGFESNIQDNKDWN